MAASDPLDDLDYYSLLAVAPSAPADDVRAAFHRFAAKYHPDRFAGAGAPAPQVERATQIYRRGAEGYRVLMDPARRRAYDAGLSVGRLRFDPNAESSAEPPKTGVWPIKVKNPMARPFAMRAEEAFKAGDLAQTKVNLKLALSRDQGNAQVIAWLEETERRMQLAKQGDPG